MGLKDIRVKAVTITIEGQPMKMGFPFESIAYLEEKYGSIGEAIKAFNDRNGSKYSRLAVEGAIDFIYAGLLPFDQSITREDVIDRIDDENFPEFLDGVTAALKAYMPAPPEVDAADPDFRGNGTPLPEAGESPSSGDGATS